MTRAEMQAAKPNRYIPTYDELYSEVLEYRSKPAYSGAIVKAFAWGMGTGVIIMTVVFMVFA